MNYAKINFLKTQRSIKGQSFTEMLIATPVLFMVILGGLDLGKMVSVQNKMYTAAYEGTKIISQLSNRNIPIDCPPDEFGPRFNESHQETSLCEMMKERAKKVLEMSGIRPEEHEHLKIHFVREEKEDSDQIHFFYGINVEMPYSFVLKQSEGVLDIQLDSKIVTYFNSQEHSGDSSRGAR